MSSEEAKGRGVDVSVLAEARARCWKANENFESLCFNKNGSSIRSSHTEESTREKGAANNQYDCATLKSLVFEHCPTSWARHFEQKRKQKLKLQRTIS